jgi:hypothetical protein
LRAYDALHDLRCGMVWRLDERLGKRPAKRGCALPQQKRQRAHRAERYHQLQRA